MRDTYGNANTLTDRRKAREKLKSKVADLMSIGLDTATIRTRLGMSNSAIQKVITEIRSDLGWQAV